MIVCKIKKWGNSMGVLIPKNDAAQLQLKEGQEVAIEITKTENPLKELFGVGKRMGKLITQKEFLKFRRGFESKWL